MMSSKDFSRIIGSLDEFNSGVVLKELCSIGVGISDGLGEGLFILIMSLAGFIVRILLVATSFVVVFLLVAILKSNARTFESDHFQIGF